tara:strand:- start:35114 stop:35725 length:612 start_codon:yes stop_codon:yes gene_type:complete
MNEIRQVERPLRALRTATGAALLLGGIVLLSTVAIIVVEVVVRKLLNTSIQGVDEIAGYGMAISFALALPDTVIRHTHIRVDVVYQFFSTRFQVAVGVASLVIFAAYLATLVYFCAFLAIDSYVAYVRSSGLLGVPLYIPQTLWVLGLAFALIIAIALPILALLGMIRKEWNFVDRLIGRDDDTAASMEEIEDILQDAKGNSK